MCNLNLVSSIRHAELVIVTEFCLQYYSHYCFFDKNGVGMGQYFYSAHVIENAFTLFFNNLFILFLERENACMSEWGDGRRAEGERILKRTPS